MPEIAYGGTITFDSNMSIDKKEQKIYEFPVALSNLLGYSKTGDTRYYLAVAREYHKVDGEPDPDAPHLHFILYSQHVLPMYRVRAINNLFRESYGRSQFYRMTPMKTVSYAKYIQKEVNANDVLFNKPHYYEMNLEQPFNDYEHELIEDLDIYM